ncbi:MAG: outer membrane protein assembly factor BamA [Thiofilum sp.]|uniref:outer membrane protein assembly factor BamA n=1 Tax=Thiofilum sp. TaxID=2212733 RepID=UPI0025FD9B9A|nr:outer membrane protein assembly factor BamA [Thiofilum sp.]MBK8453590.1 outer membrane protein assembly factor BamA [Thiofilum sp.]
MNKQLIRLSVASALVASQSVWAASFVIQGIEVQGLQRLTPNAVMQYIPVRAGQRFDEAQANELSQIVYQTGLFEDVQLARRGNVLIVKVIEREAIGEINITGNKKLPSANILEFLKKLNIAKGNGLDKQALIKAEEELGKAYQGQGLYNASVNISTRSLGQGRNAIDIKINEGGNTRIQGLEIVGNQAFSDAVLLGQFESGVKSGISFFSTRDQYSREKLAADLDKLAAFYRDRGYIKFEVVSVDTLPGATKQGVQIKITIKEGPQYRLGRVSVGGNTKLSQAQVDRLVALKAGQVFSQRNLEQTRKNIEDALGKQGFAFTRIGLEPQIDEANRIVNLQLVIDPGKRVYVRRINIRGNNRTKDEVYRREIRQLESAPLSKDLIERSKIRLQRLAYVEEVTITPEPVAGTPDQVDLKVEITERSSNQFRIGAGYSQSGGFLFNTELKQDNFMGTGKELEIAFDNSSANRNFRIGYNNPFYTHEGVSRGFNVYYNKYDASKDDISSYVSNRVGADLSYAIPLGENDAIHFKVGGEKREIVLGTDPATHIKEFTDKHGFDYRQIPATLSYVHDTRNRVLFPTSGQRHRVSLQAAIPGSDLQYAKLGYDGALYKEINKDITFALKAKVGVGKGQKGLDSLPFFEKYTAGGIGTVRGYDSNSLGPKDSKGESKGGDALFATTAEIYFPVPLATDVKGLKMSAFVDAGNVFDDTNSFKAKELRASAGLGIIWVSPFGPLEVSVARPLNAKDGDKKQSLQFSLGANF